MSCLILLLFSGFQLFLFSFLFSIFAVRKCCLPTYFCTVFCFQGELVKRFANDQNKITCGKLIFITFFYYYYIVFYTRRFFEILELKILKLVCVCACAKHLYLFDF